MNKTLAALMLCCLACAPATNQHSTVEQAQFPELRGPFLGQTPPGSEPAIFAPGIVSTGLATRDITFTPEGDEAYFGVFAGGRAFIMTSKLQNGRWSEPRVADFSGEYLDIEPCISPDGQRFFFLSTRPKAGQEPKEGWVYQDIWVMDRQDEGWSEPYNLGPPVNSDAPEFYPSVTNDNTLYFTRQAEDGTSFTYRSRFIDGAYSEPEKLGPDFNIGDNRFNVFVAPDQSYAIVPATGVEGAHSQADYWVVFAQEDGSWSEAVNLGEKTNLGKGQGWSASLSPDGAYLFFMSSKKTAGESANLTGMTLDELSDLAARPGGGNSAIWWVDSAFIEDLRAAR